MKTVEIDEQSLRLTDLAEGERVTFALDFNERPSGIFTGYTRGEKILGCPQCPFHLSNTPYEEVGIGEGHQLRPKVTAILPDEVHFFCRALTVARQKGARTPCLSK